MKKIERLMLTGMLLAMAGGGGAALPEYVEDEPFPSLAPLVERVTPAVVNIRVSQALLNARLVVLPVGSDTE